MVTRFLKIAFLCLAACLPASLVSCSKPAQANTPSTNVRILLMAVDGLEWNVMLPMVQQGRLPNIAKLMDRGTFGLLQTFEPTLSPAIWTTVATGKDRRAHGILKFQTRDAGGKMRLFNSTDRKTKAFWNILTDYNRKVNTVGWFVTYPAEEINGVMVAQANAGTREEVQTGEGTHKPTLVKDVPQQVTPKEREKAVFAVLDRSPGELERLMTETFGVFPNPLEKAEERMWNASAFSFRADSTYATIARDVVAEKNFDLTAVYIGGTDTVAHRFWRHMYPDEFKHKPSPEQLENFSDIVRKYYVYADRVIGDLVAAAGDDLTVIVMSDHGFEAHNKASDFRADAELKDLKSGDHPDAPDGVFIAAGPGIVHKPYPKEINSLAKPDLRRVANVLDVTPTILAMLNVPIGEDMEGEVLEKIVDPELLRKYPVKTIATHDSDEWLEKNRARTVGEDSEEYEAQLKGIGYIGDDDQPSNEYGEVDTDPMGDDPSDDESPRAKKRNRSRDPDDD